jgi:hypothetical protein
MWRTAAFILILCAGCANKEGTLLEDSVWGDLGSRLSPTPHYAPSTTVSSPAFYPDLAPTPPPAKQ